MPDTLATCVNKPETLSRTEAVPVALSGYGPALDVLHREVGPALRRRASVKDRGDRGVVYERQRLAPLGGAVRAASLEAFEGPVDHLEAADVVLDATCDDSVAIVPTAQAIRRPDRGLSRREATKT